MEKVVISLGGSIIIPDDRDGEFLRQFASLLRSLADEHEIYVVCGGGKVARYYIVTCRELGAGEEELDELGIEVTRLNARLLQLAMSPMVYENVPHTVEETASQGGKDTVAIMGGTTPGHTTDAVSAALAERVGASRIVNATSVDGVYSSDPRKDRNSVKFDRLSFQQLDDLMHKGTHGAGRSHVFDPLGAEIVRRCRIPILVVDGRDLGEVGNAVRGQGIKGTIIDG
jgi:uridylate kinase